MNGGKKEFLLIYYDLRWYTLAEQPAQNPAERNKILVHDESVKSSSK